jgi:uncharacterized protein Veg
MKDETKKIVVQGISNENNFTSVSMKYTDILFN